MASRMRANAAPRPRSKITDFTGWEIGRYARKPGEGLDIRVDGAVEYTLRLIPSNKVVGRFASTYEA